MPGFKSTERVVLEAVMMSLQPTSLPLESATQTSWPSEDGLLKSIVFFPAVPESELSCT